MHNLSYSDSLHQQGSSDLSAVTDCFCWHFYEFWCSTHEGVYHSGWHHCHLTVSESSQITNVHYVTDTFWHHICHLTVSQFAQNPNMSHYNAVKQIFKYLADTMNLNVIYNITDDNLINYTDADWGGCHNIRKFTEAYLFLLYEGLISWCFKCQQFVVLFLTEAEYMVKMQAMKKAIWLCCFLSEIGYFHDNNVVIIWADNNKAMNLAKTLSFMLVSSTLTYNITLFVKLSIITLLTLNSYLLLSKQQMSLLRLCLLLSLAVFLFSQVLYLINDLSSTHIQTSLLLTFLCHLYILTFLSCCCGLLHILTTLLLNSLLVRLKNFILTSEWIFRLSKTEKECWNKKASQGFQFYSDLALKLAVSHDAA
jgi:hypothetical protein